MNNIFEESNYDIELFLKNNKEVRCLNEEEVINMNALCETAIKYGFGKNIILGPGLTNGIACIFKINESDYIVWRTNERRSFSEPKRFNNINESCINLISRVNYNKNIEEYICYFNSLCNKKIDDNYLEIIANSMMYAYIPNNKLILELYK